MSIVLRGRAFESMKEDIKESGLNANTGANKDECKPETSKQVNF